MKTLILKVSIIAQGGLILCKYENAELQNLQGDYKDDGTRKSAYFLDGIRKVGHILAVFGYWNTCGHGNFILTDT